MFGFGRRGEIHKLREREHELVETLEQVRASTTWAWACDSGFTPRDEHKERLRMCPDSDLQKTIELSDAKGAVDQLTNQNRLLTAKVGGVAAVEHVSGCPGPQVHKQSTPWQQAFMLVIYCVRHNCCRMCHQLGDLTTQNATAVVAHDPFCALPLHQVHRLTLKGFQLQEEHDKLMLDNRDLQVQTLRMETEAAVAKQTASDAWQVGSYSLRHTHCAAHYTPVPMPARAPCILWFS